MKIYIDAGHGGDSIGATYKGRREQDDCLRLSLRVRNILLTQENVEVKLSRTGNTNPEISARCHEANEWGANYFCSVHRNAFSPNKAKGAEAWVYSKVETNGQTYKKAENITKMLCNDTGFEYRGIKKGAPSYADFGVNRLTEMSSCLLEVGFIDSDEDNKIFDEQFEAMALSLAKGLMAAVGLQYKNPIIKGDVDGDGKVTASDARSILRASVGLEEVPIEVGDMDGDGKITAADAREALQESVKGEV